MNPLSEYPAIRKALYLVQWVVNGFVVVVGAYYVLANESPDKWYVIVAGLGPVLWTYLGITAQQNTSVPDKPKNEGGYVNGGSPLIWVLAVVGIVLLVLVLVGAVRV